MMSAKYVTECKDTVQLSFPNNPEERTDLDVISDELGSARGLGIHFVRHRVLHVSDLEK